MDDLNEIISNNKIEIENTIDKGGEIIIRKNKNGYVLYKNIIKKLK